MSEPSSNPIKKLLNWKKWTLVTGLFVAGYAAYFLTIDAHGFLLELIHHVGLFLAAVVAVHFMYEMLVKRDEQAALRQEIAESVTTTLSAFMPSYEKWGFQGFQENLDFGKVFGSLEKDDELLWLDTYAPSRAVVAGHVTTALARGAKIRMLAIDPDSENARYRAQEIKQPGFTEQAFLADLRSFIQSLRSTSEPALGKAAFELRLYRDLPCVPMYIHKRGGVPIRGYTSYFLSNASENFAHAKWTFADAGMLRYFSEYFDVKWNNAATYEPKASNSA